MQDDTIQHRSTDRKIEPHSDFDWDSIFDADEAGKLSGRHLAISISSILAELLQWIDESGANYTQPRVREVCVQWFFNPDYRGKSIAFMCRRFGIKNRQVFAKKFNSFRKRFGRFSDARFNAGYEHRAD